MAAANHIVDKIFLQLNGVSLQQAFPVQQELSAYVKDALPARLEALFNLHFPGDAWVHIDKLQVNVSTTRPQLEAAILEGIEKSIREEKAFLIVKEELASSPSPLQAWLFFLVNGYLPWWFQSSSLQQLEKEVVEQTVALTERDRSLIRATLKQMPAIVRLVLQSSTGLIEALLISFGASTEDLEKWEKRGVNEVAELLVSSNVQKATEKQEAAICLALRLHFLQQLAEHGDVLMGIDKGIPVAIAHLVQQQLAPEHFLSEVFDKAIPNHQAVAQQPVSLQTNKSAKEDQVPAMVVKNAGLVLLHPFLLYFFDELGLLEKKKQSLLMPGKCLQLLQLLATGESNCFESDLVLNKLLCGLEPRDTAYTMHSVSANDEAECKNLLQAVINNWPSLKNTSPAGLREAFLLRDGKLSWKNDHWLLQVEQKTIDVLLNRLQWSISIVRLPWMKTWLQVDWV